MSSNKDHVLPNNPPVLLLECRDAFHELTKNEKLYAHYLSQASWVGSLIVLLQTSPESPLIFTLLHKVLCGENIQDLKKKALAKKITKNEFQAFLVYACGFFANSGNYKGFGDTKFIPDLPQAKLKTLITASDAYKQESQIIESLWEKCKDRLYSLHDSVKSLGFPQKGVTTYFSSNYTEKDVEEVSALMKHFQIEALNTRTIKLDSPKTYRVLLPSVEEGTNKYDTPPDFDCEFEVVKGDYAPLLSKVNEYLQKAKEYASNELEQQMIDKFIESFQTGSLEEHKNASRFWIRDKNPIIEAYMGFISTYRDPNGNRGEFRGSVAVVNKKLSKKFATLVSEAEDIISKLPWSRVFEKDKFLKPDFTSLDVLTYASCGIPCGFCLPKYEEIHQKEGFKNVSLGNVISCSFKDNLYPFLSSQDRELVNEYATQAFEAQVGLHELLGHGSGKLFRQAKNGVFEFDIDFANDPFTKKAISSWYEHGQTYESVFSSLASAYEECRAECVGLYLSLLPEVMSIFVEDSKQIENITYVNWLLLVISGVEKALEMYQPVTESWSQAHSQARFVISRVLLEAGEDLLTVVETEENKLLITLDKRKIHTVGKNAIRNFLLRLQTYKSTGDVREARLLFDKYSKVSDGGTHPWLKWRDIVLKNKQPRKILVQPNTVVQDDDVELIWYEASVEGFLNSWVKRFPHNEYIYQSLLELAAKDEPYFKY